LYFATPHHRRRVNAEHRSIMSAVASGDSGTAVQLLREHRDHALDALCQALPAKAPAAARDGCIPASAR
jgi:DNA-binding GntR family transcriptional regulator